MRKALFLACALLAIVVIAAWTLPAEIAYAWFGKRLLPVTLSDLSGDLWNGRAGSNTCAPLSANHGSTSK